MINEIYKHIIIKLLAAALLIGAKSSAGQTVAFTSITRHDASRPAIEEQTDKGAGRIMQINVWYPCRKSSQLMSFSDYVALAGLETDSSHQLPYFEKGIARYFAWPKSLQADEQKFRRFLEQKKPMQARRNCADKIVPGPLIMIVHGFAADHAYLAEHLASKGFIVLHTPVKGTQTYELDYEKKGLESQVLDYEFALKTIEAEFGFQATSIGVAGFSFGGQSAVALAMRNSNIKAIVSLDGGMGSAFGYRLLQAQPFYDSARVIPPILHLYNPTDPYTDLSWLQTKNAKTIAMKDTAHGHFTSFGLLNKHVPFIMGKTAPDPDDGYIKMMKLVSDFLINTLSRGNG